MKRNCNRIVYFASSIFCEQQGRIPGFCNPKISKEEKEEKEGDDVSSLTSALHDQELLEEMQQEIENLKMEFEASREEASRAGASYSKCRKLFK